MSDRPRGECRTFLVAPDLRLDGGSWTFERFSRRFAATRDDARKLGALRPLGDLAESIRTGLNLKLVRRFVDLHPDADRHEHLAVYSHRSLNRSQRLGRFLTTDRSNVPDEMILRPGDVLIPLIGQDSSEPLIAVEIASDDLPATFDHTVVALRFRDDLDPQVRRLVIAYLRLPHARAWLVAHGGGARPQPAVLVRLEVPHPRSEVLEALSTLTSAEDRYRSWADEAARARGERRRRPARSAWRLPSVVALDDP